MDISSNSYQHIWQKVLNSHEKVELEFTIAERYRWVGVIVGCILALSWTFASWKFAAGFAGVILFYFLFYLRVANAYAFTGKRVLVHTGWLSTKMTTVDYGKITDVRVTEPFFERIIMGTGSLTVNTAGTTKDEVTLKHIAGPYEVKKRLDQLRHHID